MDKTKNKDAFVMLAVADLYNDAVGDASSAIALLEKDYAEASAYVDKYLGVESCRCRSKK